MNKPVTVVVADRMTRAQLLAAMGDHATAGMLLQDALVLEEQSKEIARLKAELEALRKPAEPQGE